MPTPTFRRPRRGLVLGARNRLSGLDRRSLHQTDVVAQSVAVMAPCAAGATIPMLIVESGSALLWGVLSAIALSALVAITLGEFASRLAAPGALYTYAAKGLGPVGGVITAVAMVLGYGALGVFAFSQTAFFLLRLFGVRDPTPVQLGVAIVAIGVAAGATMIRGIRLSARVGLITEAVAVAVMLGVIGLLLVRHVGELDPSAVIAPPGSAAKYCVGVALATCGLIGFESAATLSVEAQRPLRTVPAAIRISLLIGSLVVLIATVAQALGVSVLTAVAALSDGSFDTLAQAAGVRWVVPVVELGITASFLACAMATTTALARTLMSLARENLIPSRFGHTHPRFRTPAFGIGASIVVMLIVAGLATLSGASADTLRGSMAAAPSVGFIVAYVTVCVAAPFFLRQTSELRLRSLVMSAVAAAAFGAVLVVFVIASIHTERGPGVVAALAWFVLCAVIAVVLARRRPRALAGIGIHETPIRGDVWSGHRAPVTTAAPRPPGPA